MSKVRNEVVSRSVRRNPRAPVVEPYVRKNLNGPDLVLDEKILKRGLRMPRNDRGVKRGKYRAKQVVLRISDFQPALV